MARIRKKETLLNSTSADENSTIATEMNDNQFILCAKEDTDLRIGCVKIDTGRILNQGLKGIVTSLSNDIQHGMMANDNIRLMGCEVIPYVVKENETIYVYIRVREETLYSHNEGHAVRTKRCYIPKNQEIALLTLI